MLFRFKGDYTGKRTSITLFGVTFEGREPADVTDADGIRRLSNHPEFEKVTKAVIPLGLRGDEPITMEWIESNLEPTTLSAEAPKKRGRPRKDG